MANYMTFMGKELTESLRTKRLLVLACVFLLFAISGALLARYMGEFFALIMPAGDDLGDALIAAMGDPTWQDSYVQFYSNLSQMGVLAVLFMYMGTVQREIRTGTGSLLFSKGLGFTPFILAKFTMGALLTALVTVASALVTYVYTFLLFGEAGQIGHVMLGALVFSLGLLMLLAVVIFCSSLTKSSAVSGGLSFGAYVLFLLVSAVPRIGRFSPFQLFSHPVAISMGHFAEELVPNIVIALALAALALVLAVWRLRKAEG